MTNAFLPDDSDSEQPPGDDNSWKRLNQELQKQLARLIHEICQLPAKSAQRRKKCNEIHRLIEQSKLLRCDRSPHYEGCKQKMWLYLLENLCEVNREKYPRVTLPFCDEERIMGRLNLRLRGCITDAQREEQVDQQYREPPRIVDGVWSNPVETIPVPAPEPHPSRSLPPFLLDRVRAAVESDECSELQGCHIETHPEANCQKLILQQLLPEVEWNVLAEQLQIPIPLLSSFYHQHCKPPLEKICEQQLILYIREKIKTDESGELGRCHIENYPEVTCQVLLLRRLPPQVLWKNLAVEFQIPSTTLSSFYQRNCRPKLRVLYEQQLNEWEAGEQNGEDKL